MATAVVDNAFAYFLLSGRLCSVVNEESCVTRVPVRSWVLSFFLHPCFLPFPLFPVRIQVQAKESMLAILAVCMIGTYSILESMDSTIRAQVCEHSSTLQQR